MITQLNRQPQLLLYVESDKPLALLLQNALEEADFGVKVLTDYTEATEWLCNHQNHPVDAVIIDLPQKEFQREQDAFKLCTFLRKGGIVLSRQQRFPGWGQRVPILMSMPVKERSALEARLAKEGLLPEQSVDKPINTKVLLGKLHALLQRQGSQEQGAATEMIYLRSLAINPQTRDVRLNGVRLELSPKEYELLIYMALRPDVSLPREQLLKAIWGIEGRKAYSNRNVDVYIGRLRKKLEKSDCAELLVRGRNGSYLLQTTQATKATSFIQGMDDTTEPEVVGATLAQSARLVLVENQQGLEKEILLQDLSALDPNVTGIKIGRNPEKCTAVIADKRVSREHAILQEKDGWFYLIDTKSTGGTFLSSGDSTPIRLKPGQPTLLKNGDLIRFNVIGYRFELFDFFID